MHGEFLPIWSETEREIWEKLEFLEAAPTDLYCELYRELSFALTERLKPEELADVIDNPLQSREAFLAISSDSFAGEQALVSFFEKTYESLDDLAGEELTVPYFNILAQFIKKYSLRYDLRQPCILCPTLPGIFASLMKDLRTQASQDAHLGSLMKDFDESFQDLHTDNSAGRIKTCIQKQVNLMEAIGQAHPGITNNELGGICNQLQTWPHAAIKKSMSNLYGFTSDYPGIRHGGRPDGALRGIEMRDMIATSILLIGFTPYLSHVLDADVVFRRS